MNNSYHHVLIEIKDSIAYLIFNRPDQLNAMNRQMMSEIIHAVKEINGNDSIKVGIITGNGKAFMAGADIKEYAKQTPEQFTSFQKLGTSLYDAVEKSRIPWLAAINGFALGGGFEIALSCDLILASESAKMGLPEVFLSLIPGGGGTQRLIQKTGINRVKEILFTGGQYSAQTFYEWGIVNRVFSDQEFEYEIRKFAEKISRRSPSAISQLKRLANISASEVPFSQRITDEGQTVYGLYLNEEAQKAIQDFLEKSQTK